MKLFGCVFLVGSRQAGKTSILKSLPEFNIIPPTQYVYINFDEISVGGFLKFDTIQQFLSYIQNYYEFDLEKTKYFLFDEVKNIKNFNLIIKSLIDKYPSKRFICTSSGNYEWTNEIIEGLAGRAMKINIYPLTFQEFLFFKGKKINLDNVDNTLYAVIAPFLMEYITFGGYPKVALTNGQENKKLILKSIIDSVFERDIKSFIKQEKILDIQKLFVYFATNIGSLFSFEGAANFLGLKLNDVKTFFDILQKSYLIFAVQPFYSNARNELKSKSKVYLNDFGIMNFFTKNYTTQTILGPLAEMTTFLNVFYKKKIDDKLQYWQKRNETEIDFIYTTGNTILPIEVKITDDDTIPKSFLSFMNLYGKQIDYFIRTTTSLCKTRKFKNKKIKYLPFWSALK